MKRPVFYKAFIYESFDVRTPDRVLTKSRFERNVLDQVWPYFDAVKYPKQQTKTSYSIQYFVYRMVD